MRATTQSLEVGAAVLLALIGLIISPGPAITGPVALIVLVAASVRLAIKRRRRSLP